MTIKTVFYAVRSGRVPGIYKNWDQCLKQVKGYSNSEYKKFHSYSEAQNFLNLTEIQYRHPSGLFSDGGSRDNPGIAGCGALLKIDGAVVSSAYKFLGFKVSNNIAEYQGLILGLNIAKAYELKTLTAYLDSLLVVKQVRGEWAVREPTLIKLHEIVLNQINSFESFKISHIPREENQEADELSNLAMELHRQFT